MGDKKSEDWDFKVDDSGLNKEKEAQKKEIKEKSSTLKKTRKKSKKKLKLDDSSKASFRSGRTASYQKHKDKGKVVVTPANPVKRLIAYLVDYGLVGMISYLIPTFFPSFVLELNTIIPVESADPNFVLEELTKAASAILGLVGFFFLVVIPIGSLGQTLGLKILKIRIEHIDGGRIGLISSLLRNSIGLTLNIVLVFGMIMPLFQKQKRCLHDLIFKSICIVDDYE